MIMKMMPVKIVTALFFVHKASVDASWVWQSGAVDEGAVSMKEFSSFWVEASDIVYDLDSYAKLWIKPHSCVWSECAVDDTDDGYMGDNRDGDEQWYQYRTQGFCANAAYSLYGRKKSDNLMSSFSRCSSRHYINSFFTYGGADNLLKSIGESPVVYSNGGDGDNNDNNDDGYGSTANAACVEIEYEGDDDDVDASDEENRQLSGSDSDDNDGYSGTLGCSADGKYVFAAFQSSSCDGNYYAGIVDDLDDYNKQHDSIGCHMIYERRRSATSEHVMMLLNNSWSCDLRLYPNGCPDPYGKKQMFDHAIRTVAHGGNPQRAYKNMMLKTPIHTATRIILTITVLVFIVTYLVKNESRAIQSKGGKNVVGYLRCLQEDVAIGLHRLVSWLAAKLGKNESTQENTIYPQKKSSKGKNSKKKRSKNKSDEHSESTDSSDDYVSVEDHM